MPGHIDTVDAMHAAIWFEMDSFLKQVIAADPLPDPAAWYLKKDPLQISSHIS